MHHSSLFKSWLSIVLLAATGCSLDAARFEDKRILAMCKKAEECQNAVVQAFYCPDDSSEQSDVQPVGEEACPGFNKDLAKSCLSEIKASDCSGFEAAAVQGSCETVCGGE